MSNFTSDIWFLTWLRRAHSRLPATHRTTLQAITILHPTTATRLLLAAASATCYYNTGLWRRLHYADRLEELILDGILTRRQLRVLFPSSVMVHEGALVEECNEARRQAILLGAPLSLAGTEGARDGGEQGDDSD